MEFCQLLMAHSWRATVEERNFNAKNFIKK